MDPVIICGKYVKNLINTIVNYRLNILYLTSLFNPFEMNNPLKEIKSEYIITIASIRSITILTPKIKNIYLY